jgi:hypothetical protein
MGVPNWHPFFMLQDVRTRTLEDSDGNVPKSCSKKIMQQMLLDFCNKVGGVFRKNCIKVGAFFLRNIW